MYFDKFQKMLYDFDMTESGTYSIDSSRFQLVVDITSNVRFKKEFLDQIDYYEIYRLKDEETLEHVSENLYGTPDYHWILMLLNQRYDYVEDMPISGERLDALVDLKYGSRKNDPHHFENSDGDIINPTLILKLTDPASTTIIGKTMFDHIEVGNAIRRKTAIGDYVGRIEYSNKATKEIHAFVTKGSFAISDTVQIYKYYDDANGNFVEELIGTPNVTAVQYPSDAIEVTNYEWEYFQNEKKRILRVVPQQYMQQIINEFELLMSNGK